jgi:hypothetical protein
MKLFDEYHQLVHTSLIMTMFFFTIKTLFLFQILDINSAIITVQLRSDQFWLLAIYIRRLATTDRYAFVLPNTIHHVIIQQIYR